MEEQKKYMQNRRLVTFICDNCGKEAQKPLSEYNRNIKLGRKNFCCRSCSATYRCNLYKDTPTEAQLQAQQNIKNYCQNHKDELTPFRYSFRNAKKRFKEFNLTLEDLKQIWEQQAGICPYTGLKLKLPTYTKCKNIWYRASLDRIDSSKGYIVGNVQFVSTPINFMKSTMSDLETKQYLKLISFYTSHFCEDETISSSQNEMLGAQAGN